MNRQDKPEKIKLAPPALFLRLIAFAAVALIFVQSVAAQEEIQAGARCVSQAATKPAPAGGTAILGDEPLRNFVKGANGENIGWEAVAVENQPFKYALRIQTKIETKYPQQATLTAQNVAAIAPGDTIFMRWSARTLKTGAANKKGRAELKMPFAFQSLTFEAAPEEGWQTYAMPVPAWKAFAPGAMTATLNLGGTAAQMIEIGGLEVVNYGAKYLPEQLPFSCVTYEGREQNAAWRAEAERRIERYRKGDLRVEATDAEGNPLPGALVAVVMTRHAYGFGTAVNENRLMAAESDENRAQYRQAIKKYFNEAVIENGLKWANWSNPVAREKTLNAVEWLRDGGLRVRGHTLVWASWRNSPKFLKDDYDRILKEKSADAANKYLRETIARHIADEAGAMRGKVADWDVVNETNANHDFMDTLGKDVFPEWFRLARRADPNARLYLNENTVETETSAKTDFFQNEIKYLLDRKAPVGGIGIQAHVGAISIPSFLRNLDRFARFGLPIKITEFDMVTPDKQLQAEFTGDLLLAAFSHPATEAFLMWGFWDGAHWLFDAPLFDRNWNLKPSGKAFADLVTNKWRTNVSGKTDASGIFSARGFLGEYEITVAANGKKKTVPATLAREGATVRVRLD